MKLLDFAQHTEVSEPRCCAGAWRLLARLKDAATLKRFYNYVGSNR